MHSWQCSSLGCIDIANDGVGMRAGQQAGMQHSAQFNVVNKGGFARGKFDSIYFTLSFANDAQLGGNTGIDERCSATTRCIIVGMTFTSPSTGRGTFLGAAGAMLGILQWRAPRVPGSEVLIRVRTADRFHRFSAHDSSSPQDSLHRFD